MKARQNIFILSLGCPRNLVDSEVLLGRLKELGYGITEDARLADIFIVNTCGFIESAKKESIDAIFEVASFKQDAPGKKLIVMGCLAQRYPDEIRKDIPEVDAIFGSSDFMAIPDFLKGLDGSFVNVSGTPSYLYDHEAGRELITPSHFAYVKIQEGCMNMCSYCVIPSLRGVYRSRDTDSVVKEVLALKKAHDIKEVDLIGQDTTLFGMEKYGKSVLPELLRKVSSVMKGRWVRLLYAHPGHVTDELINVMAGERAVCKYLDIPIQHISDRILKRMNRKVTKRAIVDIIENIRRKVPGVALRTAVMVGFPGETEKDFLELIDFMREVRFERLGAFMYSMEEGTAAEHMDGHVPEEEKQRRYEILLGEQMRISEDINKGFMGKSLKVLVDEVPDKKGGQYPARTEYDAPEVDGTCLVRSDKKLKPGDFVKVRITGTLEYDLIGEA